MGLELLFRFRPLPPQCFPAGEGGSLLPPGTGRRRRSLKKLGQPPATTIMPPTTLPQHGDALDWTHAPPIPPTPKPIPTCPIFDRPEH